MDNHKTLPGLRPILPSFLSLQVANRKRDPVVDLKRGMGYLHSSDRHTLRDHLLHRSNQTAIKASRQEKRNSFVAARNSRMSCLDRTHRDLDTHDTWDQSIRRGA